MDSDSSGSNASSIPATSKDISKKKKKKKVNRMAKSKQSKVGFRHEQSRCQVKDTGCKEDSNKSPSPLPFLVTEEKNSSLGASKSMAKGLDIEKSSISDFNLVLGPHMGSPFGSSDTNISCSGAEEDSDDCLDDWEAIADALAANEKLQDPPIDPPVGPKTVTHVDLVSSNENSGAQRNFRAWRPDDASRPRCLPNLLKQHTISSTCETITWACESNMHRPISCPICYEDFDLTDSSFLPCPCGFRLCLFCHKRILEADERCPGCRKPYEVRKGDVGFNGGSKLLRMGRSFSAAEFILRGTSAIHDISRFEIFSRQPNPVSPTALSSGT